MNEIMSAKGLTKRIGAKTVLDSLDVSLEAGKILGVLGPNGAGKTTFIKLLAGLLRPDAGEIAICGQAVGRATKELVAYLPDQDFVYDWLKVSQAIRYFGDCFADFDPERARQLCAAMRIDEGGTLGSLSKGMAERVRMMLTLSRKARLYLLDEPIGGIDPVARENIVQVMRAAVDEDCSILLSTHQVKDVETLLDDVLFVREGRAVFAGTAEAIREEHGLSVEQWYLEVMHGA